MTIDGKQEFTPPHVNTYSFVRLIAEQNAELLAPECHSQLVFAFARHVGIEPEEWGVDIGVIAWLLKCSPQIERACRSIRADAF